jgi:hypothetical protein
MLSQRIFLLTFIRSASEVGRLCEVMMSRFAMFFFKDRSRE